MHKNPDFRRVETPTFANAIATRLSKTHHETLNLEQARSGQVAEKTFFFNHRFCAVSELLFYNVFSNFCLGKKRFRHVSSVDEGR